MGSVRVHGLMARGRRANCLCIFLSAMTKGPNRRRRSSDVDGEIERKRRRRERERERESRPKISGCPIQGHEWRGMSRSCSQFRQCPFRRLLSVLAVTVTVALKRAIAVITASSTSVLGGVNNRQKGHLVLLFQAVYLLACLHACSLACPSSGKDTPLQYHGVSIGRDLALVT